MTEPQATTDPQDELFDIVDEADRVVGRATRREVHAAGDRHRAVQIFIWNTRGELLLHQRSATKDQAPLLWSGSAAGHVGAGDTYDETATRELREELGLACELRPIAKFPAEPQTANEFHWFYEGVTDAEPTFDPNEIADGGFFSPAEIDRWRADRPGEFTAVFLKLWDYLRAERGNAVSPTTP